MILPSTLTRLGNYNLSSWGKVQHLAFGDNITSITESGTVPAGLTIYSDTFNSALDSFAASKGINYVAGEGTPLFTLTCVVPSEESVTASALQVSDGELVVASEVPGETVTLPEGYAVLTEQQVAYRSRFLPEAPQVPAGYVFRGWYTDIELNNPLTTDLMPAADLTIYARIDAPEDLIQVKYALFSDTIGEEDETLPEGWRLYESFSRLAGEALPIPETDPELEGHIFRGWYKDPGCKIRLKESLVPTDDLTVYARFDRLTRIRYIVDVDSVGTADETLPEGWQLYAEYALPMGSAFPTPNDPSVEGYLFEGWYENAGFIGGLGYAWVPSYDVLCYAKLTKINLTAGGRYKPVEGGVQLVRYQPEEDEGTTVYLPAYVNGQPVVSIGPNAFTSGGVRILYLPETLVSIDPDAFTDSGIYSLQIGRNSQYFSTQNGILYNKDLTELVHFPAAKRLTSYTMPDTVTSVAAGAVRSNPYLKTVNFSSSLVEIGGAAFSGCTALESVTLPDSTTTIRAAAFSGCPAIETFTAYGLTTIESSENTQVVDTDDNGVERVINLTGSGRVETILRTIPKVYGPIGSGVLRDWFTYDSNGARYTFQYNQYPLTLILDGESEELTNEAGVALMSDVKNVTLADGSFVQAWYRDAEMTTAWDFETDVMPAEALTLYGTKTALYTYETGTVTVDGVERTGLILTGYNGKSANLVIPTSFNGAQVIGIGESFLSGTGTTVTQITVGGHVVSIDPGAMSAFSGTVVCDADSAAASWAASRGLNTSVLIYTLSFVSEGQTIKSKESEKGTEVWLPELTNSYRNFIGWFTDSACTNAAVLNEFSRYVMPGADTTLFAGWDRDVEAVPYTWTAANEQVTITGYTGTDARITIPATINGWPVVAIADEAFAGMDIKAVDTGTVTSIGEGAFRDCSSLEIVTLSQVTAVGELAFAGCDDLRTLNFGNALQSIGAMAFDGCEALGSVILPDSLTDLGRGAFHDCTGLKSLTIGAGLTTFVPNAVLGCSRLNALNVSSQNTALSSLDGVLYNKTGTNLLFYPNGKGADSFSVPGGVTELGESAFEGVTDLKQITLPDTLAIIGRLAFAGSGLTTFQATGLREIGENAFLGCASLTTVNPGENLQSIASGAFAGCRSLTDIYIPESATLDPENILFTSHVTITGVMGSSAHHYATAHNILFKDPNAVSVTAITLNETNAVLQRGDLLQLAATVTPANAVLGTELHWYSDDEDVAYVDEDGLMSAMGGGSAVITVISSNGITASCNVEVQVAVASVSLEPAELNLLPGDTATLTATLLPASATNKNLVWTSSDPAIVTVDENGTVTAAGEGRATVRVTAHNGLYAETEIHVFVPAESVEMNMTEALLFTGETQQLRVTIEPENATYRTLAWASSDEAVATVDVDGLVSAAAAGTTVISAETEEGLTVSCTLQVYPMPENILRIPSGTVEIEEEAFQSTAIEYVVIPASTQTIGAGTFAYNNALKIVEFEGSDVVIDSTAFEGCDILRVNAPSGSSAESWANEHDITFRVK